MFLLLGAIGLSFFDNKIVNYKLLSFPCILSHIEL